MTLAHDDGAPAIAAPLDAPFDRSGCRRDGQGIARYPLRHRSLVEMLRCSVDGDPRAEAIVEVGAERLTYATLWDRAARVAGGLRAAGIRRGDRVAIRLANGVAWCVAFFGVQLAGAVGVPVNMRLARREVDYVLADSGARFTFTQEDPLPDGPASAAEGLEPNDVAAIFYTSGTTGFPKGAMLTHEGFLSNTETCRRVGLMPADPGVRALVSVPLFHVTGCNSQLLAACEAGGTTVVMPSFSAPAFLEALGAERINATLSVPAVYWLAMHDPAFAATDALQVRWLGYGGAPIAPDLVGQIVEAFPNARVTNAFGLTETSGVATALPHEEARLHPSSVGYAAPVVDLRLDGAHGSDVGELLVRGPNVVPGYWMQPDATREAIADGWLHTGDLARIDARGRVQILDRKKDMVNRGGEKVYGVEVESAIVAHPAVFEAAVVGVPDPVLGEKVGAIVVPKPGRELRVSDLVDFLRARLADFKVPQYVVVQDALLPRNPGGKVIKRTLREEIKWGAPVW
jgi:acyl-CoA synthetase (AMP-forming)/AMP-acid ligase II